MPLTTEEAIGCLGNAINDLSVRIGALDAKVEKFTSTNSAMVQYDCDRCIDASKCCAYSKGFRVKECGYVALHQ